MKDPHTWLGYRFSSGLIVAPVFILYSQEEGVKRELVWLRVPLPFTVCAEVSVKQGFCCGPNKASLLLWYLHME